MLENPKLKIIYFDSKMGKGKINKIMPKYSLIAPKNL